MTELEKALIERDGLCPSEAKATVQDMRAQVAQGADPEELLHDLGLEPDYILDIMP